MVRNTVCASSGHLSEDESEAMWTLYGRYEDAVAVVCRLGAVRRAFDKRDVAGGLVDYSGRTQVRPSTAEVDLFLCAATKRPSYRHESEFRLLVQRNAAGAELPSLPIDPQVLIEAVVLSPRLEPKKIDFFRRLLHQVRFTRPVQQSSLCTTPF